MATATEIRESIDHLEELLNSGATSISVDGTQTTISPDAARARLRELRRDYDNLRNVRPARPIASTIRLDTQ